MSDNRFESAKVNNYNCNKNSSCKCNKEFAHSECNCVYELKTMDEKNKK